MTPHAKIGSSTSRRNKPSKIFWRRARTSSRSHCGIITVAESLDIPDYALKRLLNHKMRNDVTAGYIIAAVERLRRPMENVTAAMLRMARRQNFH
jgi:hypothetical protein